MAANPLGLLVALTVPAAVAERIEELADGIGDAARAAACPIVGGDLTHGDRISLTITVLGTAVSPVGRAGARPGDALYVTGRLGGPGAAIDALLAGRIPEPEHRARFARPAARLAESRWLASRGATAMIDVSDGLAADARHLASASGVGLEIDLGAVPVVDGVDHRTAAARGEEYELLVAAPDELDVTGFQERHGLPLTRIGAVRAGEPGAVVFRQGDRRVDLAAGYDHFSA
jgi:thiamine-monophosphate kinase